jgi:hypothetical protein
MPPAELKTSRLQVMTTPSMRRDLEAARIKLGLRGESDVARRAIDKYLDEVLGEDRPGADGSPIPKPSDSYAGRTRMLVDTAAAPERPKRVAEARPPSRLRGPVKIEGPATDSKLEPFPDTDLTPFLEARDQVLREIVDMAQTPELVELVDTATERLALDPERIAVTGQEPPPLPGEVCLECWAVKPHHASTCPAASDATSA